MYISKKLPLSMETYCQGRQNFCRSYFDIKISKFYKNVRGAQIFKSDYPYPADSTSAGYLESNDFFFLLFNGWIWPNCHFQRFNTLITHKLPYFNSFHYLHCLHAQNSICQIDWSPPTIESQRYCFSCMFWQEN